MRESSPPSPAQSRRYRITDRQRNYLIYPPPGSIVQGPLLPPQNRANLIMGNANAVPQQRDDAQQQQQRSNLSVLLEEQQGNSIASAEPQSRVARDANDQIAATATENVSQKSSPSEADSASGPSAPVVHCNSAPSSVFRARNAPPASLPASSVNLHPSPARRLSMGDVTSLRPVGTETTPSTVGTRRDVRRCVFIVLFLSSLSIELLY